MNAAATPPGIPPALAVAVEAAKKAPGDINVLFNLGSVMHDHGQHQQAANVREHIVGMLMDGIRNGRATPDITAHVLQTLYLNFVKKIETEEHARACFQSWLAPVVAHGRSLQEAGLPLPLWQPTAGRPWRIAFLLASADILGHTEAMLEFLRHRPRGLPWHDAPVVYNMDRPSEKLERLVREAGGEVVNIRNHLPQPAYFLAQMTWMRRHMAEIGVSHFVWVSTPAVAPFAMAMRLAPVQIFWTLKFHPFQTSDIDGYITYGAWSEAKRVLHGESWHVVPFTMAQPSAPVQAADVALARQPFAQHDILFGTLARTEKMNSSAYLDAVVRILRDNPRAGFLWTGKEQLPAIQSHFEQAGVANRCHFIGWVQTPIYARVLDVFLESFPFGCGLTGIQALEAGTAFVSYAAPETQYGMHFLRPLQENGVAAAEIRKLLAPDAAAGAPLLYAETADQYVAMANRLAREPEFRKAVGAAGRAYFQHYLTDSGRMAHRFLQVLTDVKQPAEGAAV